MFSKDLNIRVNGRLADAIEVLSAGLQRPPAADDPFRRAVALWSLGCYKSLLSKGSCDQAAIGAVTALLAEALRIAPQFREGLGAGVLDEDLNCFVGNPAFEVWRCSILQGRASHER